MYVKVTQTCIKGNSSLIFLKDNLNPLNLYVQYLWLNAIFYMPQYFKLSDITSGTDNKWLNVTTIHFL